MAKYCGKCGTALNEYGFCPSCDVGKIEAINVNQSKAAKKAARPIHKRIGVFLIKLLAIIFAIVVLCTAISGLLVYFDIVDVPIVSDVMEKSGLKNQVSESIDINEYLDYSNDSREYADDRQVSSTYYKKLSKIIQKVRLDESDNMMTEEEAYELFQSYGFTDCIIISEYSETGEYSEAKGIIPFSSTKHPVYRSDYIDEKGDLFEIYLIDGTLMVNPVSLNERTEDNTKVVVASAETLKSYDSQAKTFYETMPKDSIIKVLTTSDYFMETLEKITFEGGTK